MNARRSRVSAKAHSGTDEGERAATGEVEIRATPERIWSALTEGTELERWFPLQARSEPGKGGSLWMSWDGAFTAEMKILEWDPPRHLRTSWPWHASITDYTIEAHGDGTVLRVVTSGFAPDPSWEKWVDATVRGWAFELQSLKRYLEHHDGEARKVVFVRREVDLAPEDAWRRLTGPEGLPARWHTGRIVDDTPPVQRSLVLEDPTGALLRMSVEPSHEDPSQHEVTLLVSAWGRARVGLEGVEKEFRRVLERLFP